ncbi:hypothetical protein MRB53_029352 [Persea americana]|uniref:Uncharacterized protein n=1 Tax=Persea americana TaxID=3435 RepID=A0ACC2KII6_PERAE|nr:hypothetical protein MRB53_029352 [Persea americana]
MERKAEYVAPASAIGGDGKGEKSSDEREGTTIGPRTFSTREAEAQATLLALNSLKVSAQSSVILCLDALEFVNTIKGKCEWLVDPIINDIQARGRCFESLEVVYEPRKLDKVAHKREPWYLPEKIGATSCSETHLSVFTPLTHYWTESTGACRS